LGAKVLEQGPVMILTFTAQQLTFDDTSNENRSLTKDLLENVVYVWALCRDQTIYDSKSAWRVLEFGIQSSGHLLV
jgi:import inner membrane translocase subunit TIM44